MKSYLDFKSESTIPQSLYVAYNTFSTIEKLLESLLLFFMLNFFKINEDWKMLVASIVWFCPRWTQHFADLKIPKYQGNDCRIPLFQFTKARQKHPGKYLCSIENILGIPIVVLWYKNPESILFEQIWECAFEEI